MFYRSYAESYWNCSWNLIDLIIGQWIVGQWVRGDSSRFVDPFDPWPMTDDPRPTEPLSALLTSWNRRKGSDVPFPRSPLVDQERTKPAGDISCLLLFTNPPEPTQPPNLSGTGNKYQPKCGDALRLGSKGRYGSFHLWINMWMAGRTVWSLVTRAIPERFRDESIMIKRSTNLRYLLYFTLPEVLQVISVLRKAELWD